MIKSILLILLMSCSQLKAFHGFYVGGSLGGHLAEGAESGSVIGTFSTDYYPIDLQKNMFDRDSAGLLYAGYGYKWHSLYLAAEGFMQFGSATLQSQQTGNDLTISTTTAFHPSSAVEARVRSFQGGIDLLPGWIFNPATLLYARIGIGAARANMQTVSSNLGQTIFGSATLTLPLSDSKTFATLHAGVGLEQRLSSRFSLRGDYIFTDYGRLSVQGSTSGTSSGFGFPLTLVSDSRVHLYDHALLLGLTYRLFCKEPLCFDPCYADMSFNGSYLGGVLGGSILTDSQVGSAFQINPSRNNTTQTFTAL